MIEKKEAEKILISVHAGKELDTKSVTFLRNVVGMRAVDLSNKMKISKSTICNWDKKNTPLPYHLSILLCSLFANKLHLSAIEESFKEDLYLMIAS